MAKYEVREIKSQADLERERRFLASSEWCSDMIEEVISNVKELKHLERSIGTLMHINSMLSKCRGILFTKGNPEEFVNDCKRHLYSNYELEEPEGTDFINTEAAFTMPGLFVRIYDPVFKRDLKAKDVNALIEELEKRGVR